MRLLLMSMLLLLAVGCDKRVYEAHAPINWHGLAR